MHAQARLTARGAIRIAGDVFVTMAVERNGSDALAMSQRLVDVPEIESGIGGDVRGKLVGSDNSALKEWTIIGDVGFIEGQGVLGEHDIPIDRVGGRRHPGAIAEEADLFLFRGAVRLLLVAALLDTEATIGVAFGNVADIEGAFDVDIGIVLRSEEHTSELQSPDHLVCRLLLEKKKT